MEQSYMSGDFIIDDEIVKNIREVLAKVEEYNKKEKEDEKKSMQLAKMIRSEFL
jgi:hypothetical protein